MASGRSSIFLAVEDFRRKRFDFFYAATSGSTVESLSERPQVANYTVHLSLA